jgi:hypothetical protein
MLKVSCAVRPSLSVAGIGYGPPICFVSYFVSGVYQRRQASDKSENGLRSQLWISFIRVPNQSPYQIAGRTMNFKQQQRTASDRGKSLRSTQS